MYSELLQMVIFSLVLIRNKRTMNKVYTLPCTYWMTQTLEVSWKEACTAIQSIFHLGIYAKLTSQTNATSIAPLPLYFESCSSSVTWKISRYDERIPWFRLSKSLGKASVVRFRGKFRQMTGKHHMMTSYRSPNQFTKSIPRNYLPFHVTSKYLPIVNLTKKTSFSRVMTWDECIVSLSYISFTDIYTTFDFSNSIVRRY